MAEPLFSNPVTLSKDQVDLFYENFSDAEIRDADDNVIAEGPDSALANFSFVLLFLH